MLRIFVSRITFVFADIKERPSSHAVFSTAETSDAWFWYRTSHLNSGGVLKIHWYRPDNTQEPEYTYTACGVERCGGHGLLRGAGVWSSHPGTWHVAVSLGGKELARASFDVVSTAGIPEIRLRDASSR